MTPMAIFLREIVRMFKVVPPPTERLSTPEYLDTVRRVQSDNITEADAREYEPRTGLDSPYLT